MKTIKLKDLNLLDVKNPLTFAPVWCKRFCNVGLFFDFFGELD